MKHEDLRLWLYKGDENNMKMLDQENVTLEDVGFVDDDAILAEIRSRDGTWPEEISSLCGDRRTEKHGETKNKTQNETKNNEITREQEEDSPSQWRIPSQ